MQKSESLFKQLLGERATVEPIYYDAVVRPPILPKGLDEALLQVLLRLA